MEGAAGFVGRAPSVLALLRASCRGAARHRVLDYAHWPQQQEAMPEWREKLVVWMQLVGKELSFSAVSIEVAVAYFDRMMSQVRVDRHQLQTAAMACILVATKQHEPWPLSLEHVHQNYGSITTAAALTAMELDVLSALKWDANAFTPLQFVQAVTALITSPGCAASVSATSERLLTGPALRRYDLPIRFAPCEVGMAALAAACSMHGFMYDGLVQSLKAQDIPVELHKELFDMFVATDADQRRAAALEAASAAAAAKRAAATPSSFAAPPTPHVFTGRAALVNAPSPAPSTLTAMSSSRMGSMSPDFTDSFSSGGSVGGGDGGGGGGGLGDGRGLRARSAEGGMRSMAGGLGAGAETRPRSLTETWHASRSRMLSPPIPEEDMGRGGGGGGPSAGADGDEEDADGCDDDDDDDDNYDNEDEDEEEDAAADEDVSGQGGRGSAPPRPSVRHHLHRGGAAAKSGDKHFAAAMGRAPASRRFAAADEDLSPGPVAPPSFPFPGQKDGGGGGGGGHHSRHHLDDTLDGGEYDAKAQPHAVATAASGHAGARFPATSFASFGGAGLPHPSALLDEAGGME